MGMAVSVLPGFVSKILPNSIIYIQLRVRSSSYAIETTESMAPTQCANSLPPQICPTQAIDNETKLPVPKPYRKTKMYRATNELRPKGSQIKSMEARVKTAIKRSMLNRPNFSEKQDGTIRPNVEPL